MQSVQDVLEFVLRQERTVVFGNLGRYPRLLYEALVSIPLIRCVVVFSARRPLVSADDRIRVQRPADPVDRCDLLVYVEPSSSQPVERHRQASRVAVFTSHYTFRLPSGRERWIDACYFHDPDPEGTARLLARQDFPVQTNNVALVEMDRTNVVTVTGRNDLPPPLSAYVVVDLTAHNRDSLSMYLAFWDAFDYLLEHRSRVDRWVVCFSDRNRQSHLRFCQKVVDALFCRSFEHGNVTDHKKILSLLPYFRSGALDKTFRLNTSSFGGLEFAAPKTVEDACKVAAMRNVLPLVKNVLMLRS